MPNENRFDADYDVAGWPQHVYFYGVQLTYTPPDGDEGDPFYGVPGAGIEDVENEDTGSGTYKRVLMYINSNEVQPVKRGKIKYNGIYYSVREVSKPNVIWELELLKFERETGAVSIDHRELR